MTGNDRFLLGAGQRLELLAVVAAVQIFDHLVIENLTEAGVLSPTAQSTLSSFEAFGGIGLFVLGVLAVVSTFGSKRRWTLTALVAYLTLALLHLGANLGAILLTAHTRRGQPLLALWDVICVYLMAILIFAAWYWFLDKSIPGGAFAFPGEPRPRTILDYIFLSFNTSSTYGPTIEVPMSQGAKLLMMLQVGSSLLMLTVLLTRAISGG